MSEMLSGGNIRLEPGKPGRDGWVDSATDLVQARSFLQDYKQLFPSNSNNNNNNNPNHDRDIKVTKGTLINAMKNGE